MKIEVIVEGSGESWAASSDSPALHGAVGAVGDTRDEAIEQFRSAVKFHIEGLREDGQDVADVTELEIRELVPA